MIGAALALHRVTHDDGYLADAHRIGAFMIAHETTPSTLGPVLDDHGADCHDACEAFKGIGFRYLQALYLADPTHTEIQDVLSASARSSWNDARESGVDRFGVSWTGPRPTSPPSLAADASATMALQLYAILRAPAPPPPPSCGRLHEDMTLHAGETLFACDGRHRLAMQTDGNLVVYDGAAPTWASSTRGSGADRAVLQTDGNLVLYDAAGRAKWASHTQGHAGVTLVAQDDGNVVIYASNGAPLWATHTQGR
jgi:hypothetical protein